MGTRIHEKIVRQEAHYFIIVQGAEITSFVMTDGARKGKSHGETRMFPFNLFSDETYMAMGILILFFISIPTMSIIFLSHALSIPMQYAFYDHSPIGRSIFEAFRTAQRDFFKCVGHYILLDPRDSSYLPHMLWGSLLQPALFYWAWNRHQLHGLEISTFLIYHLIRVGPKHYLFAHHATLVHKEGHASRTGLYCNPFSKDRRMIPKPVRRLFADHLNAGIAGLFYGTIPNHYAIAHNKIHHRWHNDNGDVHTNMDLDRTSITSYVLYLPRFVAYWTGISPIVLFWSRGEYRLCMELFCGMIYYYSWSAFVCYKAGFVFYCSYVLYPFLQAASFLGLIAYLWHAFSEESDPNNQYINSITILRGFMNVWNEDYHVVHHHEPHVHWTDMPESFERNLDKYVECRATVFGDCQQGMLIAFLFGKKWDVLTDHFIDLQYVFSNGEKNSAADKRLTIKQVADYERGLLQHHAQGMEEEKKEDVALLKPDEQFLAHHEEVKAMLLRRLRYHYIGRDRKDEWRRYNAELNATIRDFDVTEEDKKMS